MDQPSIKSTDFIHPYGHLQETQFKEITECLDEDVKKWLHVAARKAACIAHDGSRRLAIEDYVYYMAYFMLWQHMNTQPASVTVEEKTTSVGQSQIQAMRTLWEDHKARFDDALAACNASETGAIRSRIVGMNTVWDPVRCAPASTESDLRSTC